MPRIVAVDTETFRFGEQPDGQLVVIPRMICTSWAVRLPEGISSYLTSDGDGDEMRELWRGWLEGHDLLVFHNAAFDLGVCCATFPELEPLVWDKLERGEVTDTKVREKLLALSTHGNLEFAPLPDGTKVQLSYGLGDLSLSYLGIDMSADKSGDESVRTNYDLYAGMPSKSYPIEAKVYAKRDAHVTLSIYEAQSARVKTPYGHASLSTEHFHTACDFSLFLTTAQGMRVDAERFHRLKEQMEATLSEHNLAPCIRAGIVRPAESSKPHVRQMPKATEIVEREGWPVERDADGAIDWSSLDADFRACLEEEGVKFTKPKSASLDRKALCARVEEVCARIGIEPKKTDTGATSADAEVIQDIAAFDEHLPLEPGDELLPDGSDDDETVHPRRMSPLENYQYRQAVQKIVTTELPRMTWGEDGEPAERVHFCFNVLLATGRTSSFASKHYPSGNGQQIDPRGRPCYLPEDDSWLLSTDYAALELCSVAQTTYELFGYSEHRKKINAGMDLHCNLGASLASRLPSSFTGGYEDFLKLKATEPKFYGHWRKFAKPVGLGYPGGLGANTFMSLAKKTYKVDIMKAAQDIGDEHLPGADNTTVAWHAKRIGITADNWEWTPYLRGIALSVLLKRVWLDTYPEMVAYFEWVTRQHDQHNYQTNDDGRSEPMLCYTTPLGMHRAGGSFTAVANGRAMQSPAAEGAKAAVFRLMHEIRLGRLRGIAVMHDFIHDEVLLSIPAAPDAAAHAVSVVEELMIDSMQQVLPDVTIRVESALSTRWLKQAEPVRLRGSGLLVPWDLVPADQHEVDPDGSRWISELP